MAQTPKNMTAMTILLGLALSGQLFTAQNPAMAEGTTQSTKSKPVRWQPPEDVGSSGRRSGNPPRTAQGGSRNGCVAEGNIPLTALIPSSYEGRVGVESPVFHVYFPYGGEQRVRLTVQTYTGTELLEVYQGQFLLRDAVGLVALPLPPQLALEKGFVYRWRLDVLCDGNQIGDYVEGNLSLEPRELSPELLALLAESTAVERAKIYLEQGWWYDAITVLSSFREEPQGAELWGEVLGTEGLDSLIGE